MTVEMWMGICVAVAIVGVIMNRLGFAMKNKGNKNGALISLIGWLFIMVGVMVGFSFFRLKYLS